MTWIFQIIKQGRIMFKLIIFAILTLSTISYAEEDNALLGYLTIAKATGMCGVFSQMARFQETTKMEGGNDFTVRFISTEAARLGYELNDFMGMCVSMTEKYNNLVNLVESE